jgi:hypothetical protein
MDQAQLYNGLNWTYTNAFNSAAVDATQDSLVKSIIPTFLCPSSGTATLWQYAQSGSYSFFIEGAAQYVGIAGASPTNLCVSTGTFFKNSSSSIQTMTDGTSNILAMGEYSGLAKGQTMTPQRYASPTVNGVGWHSGYDNGLGTSTSAQCTGYKTMTYAPNSAWYSTSGWGNQSLKSQHAGGVHGMLADGSVRFLNESINIQILYNISDIADGAQIVPY